MITLTILTNLVRYLYIIMVVMQKIKSMFIISGLILLLYTRLVGLSWGLPYAMHPDERNMVMAIQQLHCNLPSNILTTNYQQLTACLNPHFYAYGQFPLYIGYGIVGVMKFFDGDLDTPIGFEEATLALRYISVIASVLNVIVLMRLLQIIVGKKNYKAQIAGFFILTFSPYFIQFSHFGTTESFLMLFYSLIVYLSLRIISEKKPSQLPTINYYLLAATCGLALATKVSSLVLLSVPLASIVARSFIIIKAQVAAMQGFPQARRARALVGKTLMTESAQVLLFLIITLIVTVIFSPHNFLNWEEFISSMNYESAVGLGTYIPFYTRQFVGTFPIIFQMQKILPYALGWPMYILGVLGFLGLPWKNKYLNVIRFAILAYFIPNGFFFAKWSRFMAPIFPLISVFAVLFLIKKIKVIMIIIFITVITVVPGIAYLSIYQAPDVRFKASNWIYSHIPTGSKILSETANVIDIPIPSPNDVRAGFKPVPTNYQIINFNFYDLDEERRLQTRLHGLVSEADYIFVPSRRIFANHPAQTYPILNAYYDDLKSGKLGFQKIAEFSSYPRIELFGKTILEFPDEQAAETWTVFDHPVIRIYKRITNNKFQISNQLQNSNDKTDFSNYETTNYQLLNTNYRLLVADTPEKWEKGLMYVRSKKDIGGADGMIFVFSEAQMRNFWNKNTVSNLDIYWVNGDETVGKNFLPSIEESKNIITASSPKEVNKVIEIIVSK